MPRLKTRGPVREAVDRLLASRNVDEFTALAVQGLADALEDSRTPKRALAPLVRQLTVLTREIAQKERTR